MLDDCNTATKSEDRPWIYLRRKKALISLMEAFRISSNVGAFDTSNRLMGTSRLPTDVLKVGIRNSTSIASPSTRQQCLLYPYDKVLLIKVFFMVLRFPMHHGRLIDFVTYVEAQPANEAIKLSAGVISVSMISEGGSFSPRHVSSTK